MNGMPDGDLVGAIQQGRLIAGGLVLAVMLASETFAPMYRGRRKRVSHGLANLGLTFVNAAIAFGFTFSLVFVTELANARSIGLLHLIDSSEWTRWLLALLLFDCWQYLWHRLNHQVPFLWRFHAVHHADAELDATSGMRFHTVEILLSILARLAVLPLLGMTLPQLLLYEAIALPVIIFHHSNLRIPNAADRCLRWLIVTPWMHWVHHSRWQPETDSNYSSLLSVWDRLFGSFRLRERPEEIQLGLDHWPEEQWRSLPGMLIAPFRRAPGEDRVVR